MYRDNSCAWCYGQPLNSEDIGGANQEDSNQAFGSQPGNSQGSVPWRKCCRCCCWPWTPANNDSTEQEQSANDINVITAVNIWQNAEANGGDANGGNGGNAVGGSAAAASAELEFEENGVGAAAIIPGTGPSVAAKRNTANGTPANGTSARNSTAENVEALQSLLDVNADVAVGDAAAIGGTAIGGDGGDGGTGGNGGTASNTATVTIDNVVVVVLADVEVDTGLTLGTNQRKLNINMDKNGDTFVNGQKLDEEKLADGTKVLIYRNSEVKE